MLSSNIKLAYRLAYSFAQVKGSDSVQALSVPGALIDDDAFLVGSVGKRPDTPPLALKYRRAARHDVDGLMVSFARFV
jgi:hypothetical protein